MTSMAKISRHPASPLLNRADLGMVSVGEDRGGGWEGGKPERASSQSSGRRPAFRCGQRGSSSAWGWAAGGLRPCLARGSAGRPFSSSGRPHPAAAAASLCLAARSSLSMSPAARLMRPITTTTTNHQPLPASSASGSLP